MIPDHDRPALAKLFNDSPEFRSFLWTIVENAGVFQLPAHGADKRDLNEGRRSLGLEIVQMVEECFPMNGSAPVQVLRQLAKDQVEQLGDPKSDKPYERS